MTWAAHIAKVVEKGEKVLNTMRCLAGCDWGADRGSLQLVYQAMIRSCIDYRCFVYGSAAKSVLHKLEAPGQGVEAVLWGLQVLSSPCAFGGDG